MGWELAATCPCPGGIVKTLTAVVTLQAGVGWGLGEATCVLREQKYETFDFVLLAGTFLQDPDFSIHLTMPKAWD